MRGRKYLLPSKDFNEANEGIKKKFVIVSFSPQISFAVLGKVINLGLLTRVECGIKLVS